MAVLFDGVDDYINFGTVAEFLEVGRSSTVSIWINPSSNGTNNLGRIVCVDVDGETGYGYNLLFTATNKIRFLYSGSTNLDRISTDNAITLNTWQNVIVTWSGSSTATTAKIYVNNVEVSYSSSVNGIGLRTDLETKNLKLGVNFAPSSSSSRWYAGQMGSFAAWDKELSDDERAAIVSSKNIYAPLMVSPSNLKIFTPLLDVASGISCDGATFRDISGNGNHGTGVDGANNTGLTGVAESVLSYPQDIIYVDDIVSAEVSTIKRRLLMGCGV